MKSYAVLVNGQRVMRVGAENEADAQKEAQRQLSKPGRYGILKQWKESGRRVKEMVG